MKKIMIIALSFLAATAYGKGKADMSMKMNKMPEAVFIESKDMKWTAAEGLPGLQTSVIQGDATKGPHHAYMKFTAGFTAPLHHHTADHYATVLAGTFILTADGVEHRLPPGSYFSFKNKKMHSTACAAGAECLIFSDVRGKWDVVPEKQNTIGSK
ncbi:cupin domain-containing protein [Pseudobdellovibrio sp. HCB154]|uniref:cupin domain-containing protein n=1 Tax=Pseudobdellovibrio sp. HCB154 TaxID=3386277 RepID=UPI00391766B8